MECQSSKGQKVVRVFYGVDPSEAGAAFAYREPLKEAACLPGFVTYINISTNSFISLNDSYMYSAVVECYETLKDIIYNLLQDEEDKMIVSHICDKVEWSIQEHTFVKEFKMSGLPSLSEKLEKFLTLLSHGKSSSQHQRKRTEICQHRHQFYCQQISEGEGY
ncbi:putative callose synthase 8 isoform X13 [Arachis hypogaea]|uniref:putative callose synthase 8 isoform X13 n=1 Tax=Arachis hypogaea TaxID=3818 RepID=UPI003B20EF12